MTPTAPSPARRLLRPALLTALAALPTLAAAHGGADGGSHHGLLAGLQHPFTGLDHLLAMLAVGAWAAVGARHADAASLWRLPAAFVTLLLAGALAAAAGLALPAIEPMIAASLVALGLLLAARRELPAPAALALVSAFALFHGAAHGQELGGAPALAGMVAATALLHAAGVGLGLALRAAPRVAGWLAGGATAALGLRLLLA